jgi:hypothetical protein
MLKGLEYNRKRGEGKEIRKKIEQVLYLLDNLKP